MFIFQLVQSCNGSVFSKKKKQNYMIWQDEFHPKAIYTPEFLMQKMEYVRNDPVKKGLVLKPQVRRVGILSHLFAPRARLDIVGCLTNFSKAQLGHKDGGTESPPC